MVDESGKSLVGGETGDVSLDELLKAAVEIRKEEKGKFEAGLSGIKTCMEIIAAATNDYYQKTGFWTESRVHAKVNVDNLKHPLYGYHPSGIVDGDLSLTSKNGQAIFVFQEGSRGSAGNAIWNIPIGKLDCILNCNLIQFKDVIVEFLQKLGNH